MALLRAPYEELFKLAETILFNSDGSRRLPRYGEVDGLLSHGFYLSDLLRGERQLYFIPTVEWVSGLTRLLKHLRVGLALEVGAGDGFVASCLAKRGVNVVATDIGEGYPVSYGQHVERLSHTEALDAYRPEFVFWCWPPYASSFADRIIEHPSVAYYLDVGDGGHISGSRQTFDSFACRYLRQLSKLAFTWIDIDQFRHNRNFLFYQAKGDLHDQRGIQGELHAR